MVEATNGYVLYGELCEVVETANDFLEKELSEEVTFRDAQNRLNGIANFDVLALSNYTTPVIDLEDSLGTIAGIAKAPFKYEAVLYPTTFSIRLIGGSDVTLDLTEVGLLMGTYDFRITNESLLTKDEWAVANSPYSTIAAWEASWSSMGINLDQLLSAIDYSFQGKFTGVVPAFDSWTLDYQRRLMILSKGAVDDRASVGLLKKLAFFVRPIDWIV
jgi:hypothetical protein